LHHAGASLISHLVLVGFTNLTSRFVSGCSRCSFVIAETASRFCSAARVYRATSLRLRCPVMALISWGVQPASASRLAAAFRRPWAGQLRSPAAAQALRNRRDLISITAVSGDCAYCVVGPWVICRPRTYFPPTRPDPVSGFSFMLRTTRAQAEATARPADDAQQHARARRAAVGGNLPQPVVSA